MTPSLQNIKDSAAYQRTASDGYLDSYAVECARKSRKTRKIITTVCASVAALLVVAFAAVFVFIGSLNSNLSTELDSSLFEALTPSDTPEDPFYVLLLGTDRSNEREGSAEFGNAFRSDSIMLARIDPKNKKVAIISIPRDTYVDLGAEYGKEKINAATFFGGPTLAVKTVSRLAGVPISHYAEIDFNGFCSIVDSLGGVEVNVPIEINDPEAGGYLKAGTQNLNGQKALILCRSRHAYDDFGAGDLYRAANQRLVMSAIAQKMLSSDAFTIANSIQSLAGSVRTDMNVSSIIAIAQSMSGLNAATDILTSVAPTESQYIDGGWYEILDDIAWQDMIERIDSGKSPTEKDEIDDATGTVISSTGSGALVNSYSVDRSHSVRIRNGNGSAGLSAKAEEILKKMGYRKFDIGNANSFDYQTTLVVYKDPDNKQYADSIVDALGIGKAFIDDGTYLFDSDYLVIIGADWDVNKFSNEG